MKITLHLLTLPPKRDQVPLIEMEAKLHTRLGWEHGSFDIVRIVHADDTFHLGVYLPTDILSEDEESVVATVEHILSE